jgi:hypothetical protein
VKEPRDIAVAISRRNDDRLNREQEGNCRLQQDENFHAVGGHP